MHAASNMVHRGTFTFIVLLALAVSMRAGSQHTRCSETITPQFTSPDKESVDVFCGDGQWRIGYDLDVCNQSIFKDYDRCGGLNAICTIPRADYNNSGPTVFSCWDAYEQSQVYIQITSEFERESEGGGGRERKEERRTGGKICSMHLQLLN